MSNREEPQGFPFPGPTHAPRSPNYRARFLSSPASLLSLTFESYLVKLHRLVWIDCVVQADFEISTLLSQPPEWLGLGLEVCDTVPTSHSVWKAWSDLDRRLWGFVSNPHYPQTLSPTAVWKYNDPLIADIHSELAQNIAISWICNRSSRGLDVSIYCLRSYCCPHLQGSCIALCCFPVSEPTF